MKKQKTALHHRFFFLATQPPLKKKSFFSVLKNGSHNSTNFRSFSTFFCSFLLFFLIAVRFAKLCRRCCTNLRHANQPYTSNRSAYFLKGEIRSVLLFFLHFTSIYIERDTTSFLLFFSLLVSLFLTLFFSLVFSFSLDRT